jgi:hypothetical protein
MHMHMHTVHQPRLSPPVVVLMTHAPQPPVLPCLPWPQACLAADPGYAEAHNKLAAMYHRV